MPLNKCTNMYNSCPTKRKNRNKVQIAIELDTPRTTPLQLLLLISHYVYCVCSRNSQLLWKVTTDI